MSSRSSILALYRSMLRASATFQNYNFRDYATRSVREQFRANKMLTDAEAIDMAVHHARQNLDLIKRQTTISQLFPQGEHAMEARRR